MYLRYSIRYRAEHCGILCQSPRREHHAMTLSKPLERRKNTIGISSHHIETTSRGTERERERPFDKTKKRKEKKRKHEPQHTHAHEVRTTSREFDATGNTFPCIELVAFSTSQQPATAIVFGFPRVKREICRSKRLFQPSRNAFGTHTMSTPC